MGVFKIIAGVVIGVGAVAAAPFTGGGSVLGAATLAASLSGAATTAAVAGAVGGAAGAIRNKKESQKKEEERKNYFNDGYKAGEKETKEKFSDFLKNQRKRDEFLLLITKIGMYVAKCDGSLADEEMKEIDSFIGKINQSCITPQVIKDRINEIKLCQISFTEIISDMQSFLKGHTYDEREEIIFFINRIITAVVNADGIQHPAEKQFQSEWKKMFY